MIRSNEHREIGDGKHSKYTHAFEDSHRVTLRLVIVEKVSSDETSHSTANDCYRLLGFPFRFRHPDDNRLIVVKNSLTAVPFYGWLA